MGLSINDSVYSCVFFFLTGLHFFHLVVGLLLLSLLFWSCSFSYENVRKMEVRIHQETRRPSGNLEASCRVSVSFLLFHWGLIAS
jgi:hypothetical protein